VKGNVTEIWRVFDGQSKQLVIPVYQRNYDWSEPQCDALFDDLEEIVAMDREKHFFGAVVGKHEDSFTWVVIDGQQRLTTISILMLAMVHAARAGEIALDDASLPGNLERSYLQRFSDDEPQAKVKLKPVKDDAEAYSRLFRTADEYDESSNVTANYRFFRRRLTETALTADQVWRAIQRLEIMLLDLEKSDDPQRIFETLNSTGLALTEADKIRNFILMGLTTAKQNQLYEHKWNVMEKNVGFHTDWFIRWYLVMATTRTPRQSDVYEAFKKYMRKSTVPVDELLEDMRQFSDYTRQIINCTTGERELDRALADYRPLHSDVILPFLLPVLHDFRSGVVPLADMVRVVRVLESYLMRRTICGMWANALNKIFANAYADLRRLRTGGQSYPDVLIYLLRRRDDSSGRFPDDEEFREELTTRNIYRLRSENRSFLFERLENLNSKDTRDIAERLETGDLSIEHIMPQKLTTAWRSSLGPDAEAIHSTWLNRLGNLTVTAYNSEYSNSSFSTKLSIENGLKDSPYRLNAFVKQQESWGATQIEERTRQLADSAIDLWPYATTDFTPPAVVLPREPMGQSQSFRGREVVAYEYGDTSATVTAWSEVVPSIVSVLMRDHRARIIAAAQANPMLSTQVSHTGENGRGWVQVDPGLSVFVASSTDQKIRGLRQLFDALDLDADTLVFTLRAGRGGDGGAELADPMPADQAAHPYTELTKFLPQIEEITSTNTELSETENLREQFTAAFQSFAPSNPSEELDGRKYVDFTPDVIESASPTQVLAVIQLALQLAEQFDPAALHDAMIDGRARAWVTRLQLN
jgi:uncharacterized protein with ParB-like and HNH nuclease domain